ncbi:MAG: hypothetical protein AUJ54_00800 [Ignavibacteria bacterium CG1_02_37_35]|nr:MAG: hypothetical protein AUJ54_00800 [Ignavibacteria bacterium CG1_02_37_35]
MKKLATLVFVFAFLFGARSFAQNWEYQGVFPDTSFRGGTGVQFVTVDLDGKVWIAPYTTPKADSMFVPDSAKYKTVRRIHVYNPDGTPWDTLRSVTVGGVLYPFYNTGYGITQDKDGNILYCNASVLYKIDYKTGQGLNRLAPGIGSLAVPGVDAAGNIFVTPVLPQKPIQIYDNNFNFIQNAIDTLTEYGRWMTVSADGNTMYVPRYSENKLRIYQRPDELTAFTLKDTLLQGIEIESGAWDPISGNLWLSAGNNAYNQPFGDFAGSAGTYYEFNTTTWQKVDSLKWQFNVPDNPDERSRGIAFSKDGNTAYIAIFGTSAYPPVQKFTKSSTPPTVEFRANMSVQLKKGTFAVGDSVWVRGNFNDWAGKAFELKDTDSDSIYTGVFDTFTNGQSLVFKYVHSPDVWESTDNRLFTVAAGANVTSAYWENVDVYKPSKTIKVAFSVNMELERLSGLFNPATSTVSVRGSFNGWGETMMTASAINADLYEAEADAIVSVGERVNFKYFYSPGTWEVNNLTDPTQDNRYFDIDQAIFDAAAFAFDGNFNNGSIETVLNQDANITFMCNTNGASIIDAPAGTPFTSVHICGGNSPLQWPSGGWSDAEITKAIELFDDGTHGDLTAGDKIFTTNTIIFPQYATLNVVYKYGANWGIAGANGGSNDNEAGVGADKKLTMGRYTAVGTVVDTFGIVHTTDISKVEKLGNTLPSTYLLEQNYPNPFNPETSIRFSIPQESFVTVKVFNTLGEEVATLLNEVKTAGTYNVSFNAKNLTSGIYFYTIKANDFSSTKKMILLR